MQGADPKSSLALKKGRKASRSCMRRGAALLSHLFPHPSLPSLLLCEPLLAQPPTTMVRKDASAVAKEPKEADPGSGPSADDDAKPRAAAATSRPMKLSTICALLVGALAVCFGIWNYLDRTPAMLPQATYVVLRQSMGSSQDVEDSFGNEQLTCSHSHGCRRLVDEAKVLMKQGRVAQAIPKLEVRRASVLNMTGWESAAAAFISLPLSHS